MILISDYMKLSKDERQAHLDTTENCVVRGGYSVQFRGLLAHFLDTEIPSGHLAHCCHACHNPDCCNPRHLYWGTPRENSGDMLDHRGDEISVVRSLRAKGDRNPNYGARPWRISGGKIDHWRLAGKIYDENLGRNWTKYGSGPSFLQKEYGLAQGSSKRMISMFRGGWNPYLDSDWLKDFGEE